MVGRVGRVGRVRTGREVVLRVGRRRRIASLEVVLVSRTGRVSDAHMPARYDVDRALTHRPSSKPRRTPCQPARGSLHLVSPAAVFPWKGFKTASDVASCIKTCMNCFVACTMVSIFSFSRWCERRSAGSTSEEKSLGCSTVQAKMTWRRDLAKSCWRISLNCRSRVLRIKSQFILARSLAVSEDRGLSGRGELTVLRCLLSPLVHLNVQTSAVSSAVVVLNAPLLLSWNGFTSGVRRFRTPSRSASSDEGDWAALIGAGVCSQPPSNCVRASVRQAASGEREVRAENRHSVRDVSLSARCKHRTKDARAFLKR